MVKKLAQTIKNLQINYILYIYKFWIKQLRIRETICQRHRI